MELKKEPFLSDYCVEFQQNFQFMDLSLSSSSEIFLFHLKIPKSKLIENKIKTEPSIAPLPEEIPKNTSKNNESPILPSKIIKNTLINEQETKIQGNVELSPNKEIESSPISARKVTKSQMSDIARLKTLSLENFWLPDISPGKSLSYLFTIEKRRGEITYAFIEEETREIVIRAICSSEGEINITNGTQTIGAFDFEEGGVAYAYIDLNGKEVEIASAIFYNDSGDEDNPVQFTFLIPSLRKNSEGAYRFFIFPRDKKSMIVEKYNNKQKGVIDCLTKPKEEIVNLFERPHKSNFILNPSAMKGLDVLTLKLVGPDMFKAEMKHPFSPIQGFIGCVISQLNDII